MILHVLDFDRGDTCKRINALSTGLTVTTPEGHPRIYDHETIMMQADLLVIAVPCLQEVTCVLFANLEKKWPQLSKLYLVRIPDSQLWLFPALNVYQEKILMHDLLFMEAVYEAKNEP